MTTTEAAVEDRYPTRIEGSTHLLERDEPTVWTTDEPANAGPMDECELSAYEAKGFAIIEGLLSPAEVQGCWAELQRLFTDQRVTGDQRVVRAADGAVRGVFAVHEVSSLFGELVRDPRVLDRAKQVLGSDVYVHQSKLSLTPGFADESYFWRSEFERWHAEDGMVVPRAVILSVTISEAIPEGAARVLIPGSHRTFVSCGPDGRAPETDVTKLAAEHGLEQFTGQAGSALLADCNLLHAASNNITPYPQATFSVAFNSVCNQLVEPFSAQVRRPTHLASRRYDSLTR